jgi:hypothetical protein
LLLCGAEVTTGMVLHLVVGLAGWRNEYMEVIFMFLEYLN